MAVPISITICGHVYSFSAATATTTRSLPAVAGSSSLILSPVFTPGPTTLTGFLITFSAALRQSSVTCGTTEEIICTFILIIAGILSPIGEIAAPVSQTVAEDGIIAGYQTMDILVVSGFGLVMLNTLRLKGYVERKSQIKAIIGVCIVAGILLSLIYGGLAYLGATSSVVLGNNNLNQAQLIVAITNHLMGHTGMVILGIIVGFACLTTAVGLIGSTACFFEDFTNKKIKYPVWVVINTLISISLCNLGLTTIINVAVPILTTICPPFMITVLLLLFRNQIRNTLVYKGIAFVALVYGLVSTVQSYM